MSEASGLERYTPQHPLPEEIKKMTRDETVCQFCGVSYLIHTEIKKLEERLKNTEKQLEHYKGAVEREQVLIKEVEDLKLQREELENSLNIKDSQISSFDVSLQCEKDLSEQLKKEKNGVCNELEIANNKSMKYEGVIKKLPGLFKEVHQQKSDIEEVRKLLQDREDKTKEELNMLLNNFTSEYQQHYMDYDKMTSTIQNLEMEKLMMSQSTTSLNSKLKSTQNDIQKLQDVQVQYTQLSSQHNELQLTITNFKEEISSLKTENSSYLSQIDSYKQEIKDNKSENIIQQHQIKNKQCEDIINRLENDIKDKESNLVQVFDDYKKLQNKFHEQQRKELELSEKSTLNLNEVGQLKEQLSILKDEIDSIKAEREVMINGHQNRIEELREQFKQKTTQLEEWPDKLNEELKTERLKYDGHLKTLENKLKENFIIELEIEKDKYKELMSKYQAVNKDRESKWKEEVSKIENSYKSELNQLKQNISDNKDLVREKENQLTREITSLKQIITDLENRLGQLDNGNSKEVSQLKSQLRQTKSELEEAISDMKKMAENLTNSKQEIKFLQDTVSKECEERFELTECLNDARQELLKLKKPLGGYSSVTSRRSSLSTPTSHSRNSIIENNIDNTDTIVSKPSTKSSSVIQNRRRIANILGKQS